MAYEKLPITRANPLMVVMMVDQSGSMAEEYPDKKTKAEVAAKAVNSLIEELVLTCRDETEIKDRCFIVVVEYGGFDDKGNPSLSNESLSVWFPVTGVISKIADEAKIKKVFEDHQEEDGIITQIEVEEKVWLEPKPSGGTPMADAFNAAYDLIETWLEAEHYDNFPPIVINITDGEPNDLYRNFVETKEAAEQVMSLKSSDGNVLILNVHISNKAVDEIVLPNDESLLTDSFGKFLFQISSVLPEPLFNQAKEHSFSPELGARGLIVNAKAKTLVSLLNFGTLPLMR